jgi:catechol 2,3-dioxygenase-like lactoylglutathione lyase family enzyme
MGTLSLDHLTVGATDKWASATFLADMFDLPSPEPYGPFAMVRAEPTAILFSERFVAEFTHHLAFVVSDDEFDAIIQRLDDRGVEFFADPFFQRPGEINDRTGRGVYFRDPDGHGWEAITQTDRGLL